MGIFYDARKPLDKEINLKNQKNESYHFKSLKICHKHYLKNTEVYK